jgi:UPF0755 protein
MRHRLRSLVAGLIILVVVVIFIILAWYMLALRPVNAKNTQTISYTLAKGTSTPVVAKQLQQKGIIRSQAGFTLYVTLRGLRSTLQAGDYELSPSSSTQAIAGLISGGKVTTNQLVVPDGVTVKRFRQLAVQHGIPAADLDAALAASYPNALLASRPVGTSLEGYLFPNSYEIPKAAAAGTLVQSMLDAFQKQLATTDVAARYAAEGLTLHQGITLASIVEKEVGNDQDRALVAQVYLNRLKQSMPLQADPTVAYVADITGTAFNTQSSSPYNTYVAKGLPPGPICSPSLSSLKAVAHPMPNDYLYFIADKTGKTHYAKTFAEHQKNVDAYLK